MPSAGIEAIVVGDVVPVVEISRAADAISVLMVPDGGIGDGTQARKIGRAVPIPVIELGHAAAFIDISQVQKQVRLERVNQVDHVCGIGLAAGTIPGSRHHEGLAAGWNTSSGGCEVAVVYRGCYIPIVETDRDLRLRSDKTIPHQGAGIQGIVSILPFVAGQGKRIRAGIIRQKVRCTQIEYHALHAHRGANYTGSSCDGGIAGQAAAICRPGDADGDRIISRRRNTRIAAGRCGLSVHGWTEQIQNKPAQEQDHGKHPKFFHRKLPRTFIEQQQALLPWIPWRLAELSYLALREYARQKTR